MTQREILKELEKLSMKELLQIASVTLRLLQESLQKKDQLSGDVEVKQQMAEAAKILLPDYQDDDELTGFAALDGEDFHA